MEIHWYDSVTIRKQNQLFDHFISKSEKHKDEIFYGIMSDDLGNLNLEFPIMLGEISSDSVWHTSDYFNMHWRLQSPITSPTISDLYKIAKSLQPMWLNVPIILMFRGEATVLNNDDDVLIATLKY